MCQTMTAANECVRPSIETLEKDIQPPSTLICPVGECGKTFSNSSHLTLHKAKVHRVDVEKLATRKTTAQSFHFYCPVSGCIYHKERHFTSYKLLKKHYGSVHGEKKFVCSKCKKGFGFSRACKRHEDTCGTIYNCKTCDCPYTTKEALYMHCIRKQHELPDSIKDTMRKFSSEKKKATPPTAAEVASVKSASSPQPCIIFVSKMEPKVCPSPSPLRQLLPKPVIETVIPMTRVTVHNDNISVEKFSIPAKQTAEIQTDIYGISRPLVQRNEIQKSDILPISRNTLKTTSAQVSLATTGIQTNLCTLPNRKRHCSIAETQTSGDFILKSAMASADIPISDTLRHVDKSQRSPRSKVKLGKRQILKTSEVQTYESFPPKKKRKRRNPGRQISADACNTENIEVALSVATSTRTEQLILDYPSSISTQTQKSFLEEYCHGRHETQPVQNSETQTSLSALFRNMNENLLSEENPAILSDLGISFGNDHQSSVIDSNCEPGHANIETNCDTVNNSQSSTDFMSAQPTSFLDLLDAPLTSQDSVISANDRNNDASTKSSSNRDQSNRTENNFREDVPLRVHSSSHGHAASIATQMSPGKQIEASSSTTELYFQHYSSTAIDFGVQAGPSPAVSQTDPSPRLSKWNPCLASTAAKHMQTQTMTPKFVDFGAQTLSSPCQGLNFLDSTDGPHIEGQGPMFSSNVGTDMHTQTADDLLDFLMTNMQTQTEGMLETGLGLADIETQTPDDNIPIDTLVTTETQTNMQSLVHEESDLTLFTDMQTQTYFNVVEFESNDLTDSHTQTNIELFSL